MSIADFLALFLVIYAAVGIVFGVYFVFARAHRIDDSAKSAGLFLKVLIFFGSAALWPALVSLAFGDSKASVEINAHRQKERN